MELNTDQIKAAAKIYHDWQNEGTDGTHYAVPELYRSVEMAEIEQNGWVLTPASTLSSSTTIWTLTTKKRWRASRPR